MFIDVHCWLVVVPKELARLPNLKVKRVKYGFVAVYKMKGKKIQGLKNLGISRTEKLKETKSMPRILLVMYKAKKGVIIAR